MKKLLNLENFTYITLIAMPAYLIRFSWNGVSTNLFEIMAVITIVLFLNRILSSKIEPSGYGDYKTPITMLLVGLLFSALYSGSNTVSWGILKSWFIIPMVFAWAGVQLLESKKIIKAMYYSAFGVASLALVYFLLGQITFDGRLQAFYNSPNYLAMYLAPAIIIGIFFWRENFIFYGPSLGVLIIAFYLTQSYAAWLAVFIALAIIWIIKKELFGWRVLASLFLVASSFFLLQIGTTKLFNLVHATERSSASSRLMIWSAALKIGLDNPVLGIGPGNFQNKYLEYQKYFPPYLEWAVPQPHNLFLAFWLQAGLIGLIGFIWLLIFWFRRIMSGKGNQSEKCVYLGIMLYILLHGLADTTYFKNDLAVVFWMVIFAINKNTTSDKVVFNKEKLRS